MRVYIVLKLSLQRDNDFFYNYPAINGLEVVEVTADKAVADKLAAELGGPINKDDVCQQQAGVVVQKGQSV